mmetsp:Transcript_82607/g.234021  ORF Transcript_82607/g.234021 Transcript_82607/m.234021 type:complete len:201 (-) Transcript_82607:57-659(-)
MATFDEEATMSSDLEATGVPNSGSCGRRPMLVAGLLGLVGLALVAWGQLPGGEHGTRARSLDIIQRAAVPEVPDCAKKCAAKLTGCNDKCPAWSFSNPGPGARCKLACTQESVDCGQACASASSEALQEQSQALQAKAQAKMVCATAFMKCGQKCPMPTMSNHEETVACASKCADEQTACIGTPTTHQRTREAEKHADSN